MLCVLIPYNTTYANVTCATWVVVINWSTTKGRSFRNQHTFNTRSHSCRSLNTRFNSNCEHCMLCVHMEVNGAQHKILSAKFVPRYHYPRQTSQNFLQISTKMLWRYQKFKITSSPKIHVFHLTIIWCSKTFTTKLTKINSSLKTQPTSLFPNVCSWYLTQQNNLTGQKTSYDKQDWNTNVLVSSRNPWESDRKHVFKL